MYTIILLILWSEFCVFGRKSVLLLVIITLIPFTLTIKSIFDNINGTGYLITLWKEIAITILFIRVNILKLLFLSSNKEKIYRYSKFPNLLIILLLILLITYLLFSNFFSDALLTIRTIIFPILLALTISKISLKNTDVKEIIHCFFYSSFICFILALLQYYYFSTEFSYFFNLIESISKDGVIQFKQSAAKIIGHERMYGIFGGPNELGLYSAVSILFAFSIILFDLENIFKIRKTALIIFINVGFIVLVMTFSRVSMFFFIVGLAIMLVRIKLNIDSFIKILIIFTVILIEFIIIQSDKKSNEIYSKSLTLKEASSADRPRAFVNGLTKVIENMEGLGLGSVIYKSKHQAYHTEIFWWMIFLEIGIFGGFLYMAIILKILINIKHLIKRRIQDPLNIVSFSLLSCILLAGFGSTIIAEFVFLTTVWSLVGLSINASRKNMIFKINHKS